MLAKNNPHLLWAISSNVLACQNHEKMYHLPTKHKFNIRKKSFYEMFIHLMDPCAFHFVEIQSVFCLYLQNGFNFLIKLCSSDPSFNRNILRALYLKFKTSALAHIAIAYYYALFTNFLTWHEFLKLPLVYILINGVGQWFYQPDHVTFVKIYSNL